MVDLMHHNRIVSSHIHMHTPGISDFFFACGDSLVESFVDGFHVMPISIMCGPKIC